MAGDNLVVKSAFLTGMSFIYLCAFSSIYVQIPGLYGSGGITPVKSVVQKYQGKNLSEILTEESVPNLVALSEVLGVAPDGMMEIVALFGMLMSALSAIFTSFQTTLVYLLLWILYFSIHKVGQVFMWFQWDSLLLEAGFLTALFAPVNLFFWRRSIWRYHDGVFLFLIQWLLFRLMFASGVVKLTSGCPTWWSLTALNYHYESQCIPTSLSWFAHHLPEWFQKLSVASTYYIEIIVPFLFLVPVRSLRIFAFWAQVFFQLCIIATGNYNFFNLLTVVLCFSLLENKSDDGLPKVNKTENGKSPTRLIRRIFILFFLFLPITLYSMYYAGRYFNLSISTASGFQVNSLISFDNDSFNVWVSYAVRLGALQAVVVFLWEVIKAFYRWFRGCKTFISGVCSGGVTLFYLGIAGLMFTVSLVPHSVVDGSFYNSFPKEVTDVYYSFHGLSIISPYGLFRRMTGVGGRPELIIEGSNDLEANWKEYEFLYKPGDVTKPLPFLVPHQARLDWQMWFAALGNYHHNPWIISLVHRLLLHQKDVLELMDEPPFGHAPKYIRVLQYTYHYSELECRPPAANCNLSHWWSREFSSEYIPPLTKDEPTLLDFLKHHHYLPTKDNYKENSLSHLLFVLRNLSREVSPHHFVWGVLMAVVCIQMTVRFFSDFC